MRILVVDNNIRKPYWGAQDLARFAAAVPGATVEVRRAPQEDLPTRLTHYDRVIVSGSVTSANDDAPWIERLQGALKLWVDRGTPVLGVCYGHQMIARTLGGKSAVRRAAEPEFGWTEIQVSETDPLFSGLPRTFHSYSSHYDEVCELAPGMKRLASSEICQVQAFAVSEKPIWGIQFHPEKTLHEATVELRNKRLQGEPKKLLNANSGEKLFNAEVGAKIFSNFLTQGAR